MAKTQQTSWVEQLTGPLRAVRRTQPPGHAATGRADAAREAMPRPGRRLVTHGVMVDEDTNECSLVSLPAPTVIALSPLPEDAPEPYLWFGCALSVQTTPPDCTVVLDFVRESRKGGHDDPADSPPCPAHAEYKCYLVSCLDGELFLVRCCLFGYPDEVLDAKVFRWYDEDNAWETVEIIAQSLL
ncbi:hypothetical protein ZWY2020_042240 [Hordeum vulgare]|nr:hypothetical protein ZWY2020_042240 [Hordeum vulgare]